MKRLLGLSMSVLGVLAFATARAQGKTVCTPKELKRLDCRLTSGAYNVRLLEKTVAWSDSIWHTVDPLPLSGEGVAWESARFDFLGGHPILQLWIWGKGVGESAVQSLHWYVADAEKRKFTILAEGVVRRRRLKEPATASAPPAGAASSAAKGKVHAPRFLYDAEEKHALRPGAHGALEWTLGAQKKILKVER